MPSTANIPEPPNFPDALKGVRNDFPILNREVNGKPLVYLDNAASTQKPQIVIDALTCYYKQQNANIHRGVHILSTEATAAYENARRKVARFIGAQDSSEVVFTRGATESINLLAQSFVAPRLSGGDEILISHLEHHANIVPWQLLCEQTGAILKVIPVTDDGELDLTDFDNLLTERTKLLSLIHVSNAIGTVNDVKPLIAKAKAKGIPVHIDAAQVIQHMPLDAQDLDCDFLSFSGHKLFAPTGIGIFYGRRALLDEMRPYQGGGDMISRVSFEGTTFKEPPSRFEAGTPHIAGGIGLGIAIDYLETIGMQVIHDYESKLIAYAEAQIKTVESLKIIGNPKERAGAISFVMEGAHPHDIGTILDADGIAIRAGHHCCEPLLQRLGTPATARASFSFYNASSDVDALVKALGKVAMLFS